MADWSEIFEQRLQTMLQQDSNARNAERTATGHWSTDSRLDLGPTPTVPLPKAEARPKPSESDLTRAFFESIRKRSCSGGIGHESSNRQAVVSTIRDKDEAHILATPARHILGPASSPPVDIQQPVIEGLQESYSNRARDLHGEAMKCLTSTQDELDEQLATMAYEEGAFLSAVMEKQAQFGKPTELWMVKIQTREKQQQGRSGLPSSRANLLTERDERIVDRIMSVGAAATALESGIKLLWEEWSKAQDDATTVLQALMGGYGESSRNDDTFNKILAKAEGELSAAAAEAVEEMKANEKAFKKQILAEEGKLAQMMLARQSKYD